MMDYTEKKLLRHASRPVGTSGWIANTVQDAIFEGTLHPGDRIVEGKLAKELGVGISPVREALQQLEHVGLVERYLNKGTFVTQLSATQIKQIYRLREELEVLSLHYAIDTGDRLALKRLQECADEMLSAGKQKDYSKFFKWDFEFHKQICRVAADPYIEKCLLTLITPLFAFVQIRLRQEKISFDFISVAKEHLRFVEIIRSAKREEAMAALHRLMGGFRSLILEKLYPRQRSLKQGTTSSRRGRRIPRATSGEFHTSL